MTTFMKALPTSSQTDSMIVVVLDVQSVGKMQINAGNAAADYFNQRAPIFEQIFDCVMMGISDAELGSTCQRITQYINTNINSDILYSVELEVVDRSQKVQLQEYIGSIAGEILKNCLTAHFIMNEQLIVIRTTIAEQCLTLLPPKYGVYAQLNF